MSSSWGIKEPEDHEKDPMISREAIYHASTVLMPDEHYVASAYQDAIDDLDRKKRPRHSFISSVSTLGSHSSSSTSLLPTHSAGGPNSSSSSLVPSSTNKAKAVKAAKKQRDDIKTLQSDYYRTFRTRILLLWIVVNGALVIAISSDQLAPFLVLQDGSNLYVTIVVWTITIGATGRFLGSLVYLLGWIWQFLRQLRS